MVGWLRRYSRAYIHANTLLCPAERTIYVMPSQVLCAAHIIMFIAFLVFLYDMYVLILYTLVNKYDDVYSFSSSFSVVCIKLTCIQPQMQSDISISKEVVTHKAKTMLLNIFHLVCMCAVYLFALFLGQRLCTLTMQIYFLYTLQGLKVFTVVPEAELILNRFTMQKSR